MEEKNQEKKEQVLKFVGSAYQNNSLNKDGEIVKLNTPFYNVTIDKDALKGLKSDNKGMLYFAVHQRQDLEPDSKKPNCFIIEKNKNIIDIDSVKDFSVKKSEIMGLPTKDFTNADGTVKQSICLLITTDGVIKLNNKALGLEGASPILEGKAYEINTLSRKAELVKKIENTDAINLKLDLPKSSIVKVLSPVQENKKEEGIETIPTAISKTITRWYIGDFSASCLNGLIKTIPRRKR